MARGLVIALVVVAILVVAIIGWAISINNQLVGLEQGVNEKAAQVQNVYQRRADLVPNLVETVKGFATQERTVLEEVTRARASATSVQLTPEALNDPKAMERFQAAQSQLTGALSRLMVTVERYPELKSNQNFLSLQTQLEGTENRITVERQRFNAIFPSLEGESLEDFSIKLAERWRAGQKGLNNGVILVVFARDRKLRFEVGYGLEPVVPDIVAGQIIRDVIAPRFREGNYAAGLS